MKNTHSLNQLPSQYAIDSIANYLYELTENHLDYEHLLGKLKKDPNRLSFAPKDSNKMWMLIIGNDYLRNPTLLEHAPLIYICIILNDVFKEDDLEALAVKLPATILKPLLTRLYYFKLH